MLIQKDENEKYLSFKKNILISEYWAFILFKTCLKHYICMVLAVEGLAFLKKVFASIIIVTQNDYLNIVFRTQISGMGYTGHVIKYIPLVYDVTVYNMIVQIIHFDY